MTLYRKCLPIVAAVFLLAAGLAPAKDDPVLELAAVGMLEVGPDGSVHDYTLESDLDPAVASLVDRTVRSWRFEPVLVDGDPVIAVTRMRLDLEAVPAGESFVLRVADVSLGAPDPADMPLPPFPPSALGERVGAKVTLLVQVDADGRVQQVHVEQVSMTRRMGKRGEFLRQRFADVSREAALGWTFGAAELIDGERVAARYRVPVTFAPGSGSDWAERQDYIPGPYHPAPWADLEDAATGGLMAEGEAGRLDSRVKLRDEVVGSTL